MNAIANTIITLWQQLDQPERMKLAGELGISPTASAKAYVHAKDACRMLAGVSRQYLYVLRDRGKLKTVKFGGRTGWDLDSITAYQKECAELQEQQEYMESDTIKEGKQ